MSGMRGMNGMNGMARDWRDVQDVRDVRDVRDGWDGRGRSALSLVSHNLPTMSYMPSLPPCVVSHEMSRAKRYPTHSRKKYGYPMRICLPLRVGHW